MCVKHKLLCAIVITNALGISTNAIAGVFTDTLTFRGYDCVNGKASKIDGYVEMSFVVKENKVIQKYKSVDLNTKEEFMQNISELSDCVIFDNKNWKCGGGTYAVGKKTYERYTTKLIDGSLFFGLEHDRNLPKGCKQTFVWEKIN